MNNKTDVAVRELYLN